jgi:hypothetical protein
MSTKQKKPKKEKMFDLKEYLKDIRSLGNPSILKDGLYYRTRSVVSQPTLGVLECPRAKSRMNGFS